MCTMVVILLWLLLDRGIGEEVRGYCATVPAELQFTRVLFTAVLRRAARVVGALGTPAAGLCPWPAREKGFPSNLFLP